MNHPVGIRGIMLGVGHHDNGCSLLVQLGQQVHDFRPVFGIEVSGRLVGKDQLGPCHDGTGNGNPLLLSPGKLLREVLDPVTNVHPVENRRDQFFFLRRLFLQVDQG